ncbi:cyclin-dependent kinase 20 isoform X2 [Bacillus rossius redtenbacheri]|uniref:cyclin-dependent kinase 20 isoform X2 n=1 Tax=Bacillus rossius redtenbacheri TaxID=93214 RepID=UPI002FDD51AC
MEMFKVMGKIGEGAHGLVLRGRHIVSGHDVALKKVTFKKFEDGIPNSVLREIKALRELDSDYDLKPANLLVSRDGVLKIADLGLARIFWSETRPYSHQVATRWYRAPELLYGARHYTHAVDLWAVGCILAEMHNRHPLFPGETDIEQLAIVVRTLGTPTEESWPGLTKLPDYNKITFPHSPGLSWRKMLPGACPEVVGLVRRFLLYPAGHRLPAEKALVHPYFFTEPLPCLVSAMPKPEDGHRQRFKRTEYNVDMPADQMFQALNSLLAAPTDN